MIEVLNTIGMKSRGERIDTHELQKLVAGVMTDINDARLKQNASRIMFLADRIVENISKARFPSQLKEHGRLIESLSEDIYARLPQDGYFHVLELSGSVNRLAGSIVEHNEDVEEKELSSLPSVSNAVQVCFNTDDDSIKFAHQLMRMVIKAIGASAQA